MNSKVIARARTSGGGKGGSRTTSRVPLSRSQDLKSYIVRARPSVQPGREVQERLPFRLRQHLCHLLTLQRSSTKYSGHGSASNKRIRTKPFLATSPQPHCVALAYHSRCSPSL